MGDSEFQKRFTTFQYGFKTLHNGFTTLRYGFTTLRYGFTTVDQTPRKRGQHADIETKSPNDGAEVSVWTVSAHGRPEDGGLCRVYRWRRMGGFTIYTESLAKMRVRLTAAWLACLLPLTASLWAQAPMEIEAVALTGEPFGVGRIDFVTPANVRLDAASGDPVILQEKNGRLHYPAFSKQPVRGLLRGLLNRPQKMTAWFLFRGREPLEISIPELGLRPMLVQPVGAGAGESPLLTAWWQAYTSKGPLGGLFSDQDATPPDVRDYLTSMLAHRLRLPPVSQDEGLPLDDPIGLLLGSEELRIAMMRQTFARGGEALIADQPLPQPIRLPIVQTPAPAAEVKVEALASHVPEECFYARFGGFGNFQWFRTYLSDTGGDVRQLVSARGLDYGLNTRLEQQLLLKTTLLSKMFGDLLISDAAFIGNDIFLREGASIGLLFQSRNNGLLANNFLSNRKNVLAENAAASEQQVEIAGHNVSYISTPDGAVRSYYATDGDYHLFATSRKLVERFYEAGAGRQSLAATTELLAARAAYPTSRGDAVFLFLSTPLMQQLVSPQYRLETGRRLRASVNSEMLQLARLAAKAEGRPELPIDELISHGYLPPGFGREVEQAFLPVPDVTIEKATLREVDDYRALAQYVAAKLESVEPWVVAIKRSPVNGGQERVAIDARISPSLEGAYDFLTKWLKDQPPAPQQLGPVPGDVVQIEALLNGRQTFAGLRDSNPLRIFGLEGENLVERLLISITSLLAENIVGYVGLAGNGVPDFLGDLRFGPPDPQGFSRSSGPIWRRQWGGFSVMSFHPRVLDEVVPRLTVVNAERPAHARVRIADLHGTQLADGIDSFVARRAKAVSLGNVHLLDSLHQQLHVPPVECRDVAERLFKAKLICPVGGKFALAAANERQAGRWRWEPPGAPKNNANAYLADVLNWCRGVQGDAVLEGKTVTAHLEVLSQPQSSTRPAPPPVEVVPPPAP